MSHTYTSIDCDNRISIDALAGHIEKIRSDHIKSEADEYAKKQAFQRKKRTLIVDSYLKATSREMVEKSIAIGISTDRHGAFIIYDEIEDMGSYHLDRDVILETPFTQLDIHRDELSVQVTGEEKSILQMLMSILPVHYSVKCEYRDILRRTYYTVRIFDKRHDNGCISCVIM